MDIDLLNPDAAEEMQFLWGRGQTTRIPVVSGSLVPWHCEDLAPFQGEAQTQTQANDPVAATWSLKHRNCAKIDHDHYHDDDDDHHHHPPPPHPQPHPHPHPHIIVHHYIGPLSHHWRDLLSSNFPGSILKLAQMQLDSLQFFVLSACSSKEQLLHGCEMPWLSADHHCLILGSVPFLVLDPTPMGPKQRKAGLRMAFTPIYLIYLVCIGCIGLTSSVIDYVVILLLLLLLLCYMIDSNSLSFFIIFYHTWQWFLLISNGTLTIPDRGFQPRADGGAVRELQPDVPW